MSDKFRIRISSNLDYEEMIVDVCYENHTVATISQERGIDNMDIEIFPPEEGINSWTFPLNDFFETILFAKKRLFEIQKLPED